MPQRKVKLFLYICVLLSGISGLIYEVVWAKYLSVLFGNTTYAYTVVLATFMGGLALGSFLFGRLADKMRDKLVLYALTEIGIALFCVFTPRLFALSKHFYLAAARHYPPHSPELTFVMCVIGSAIMLLPTMLMGGTVPILSAFVTASRSSRGKTVARLYYVNSFGAVVGTVLSGYYLIYHFGLGLSVLAAAFVNLCIGLFVLIVRICSGRPVTRPWADSDEDGSALRVRTEDAYPGTIVRVSLIAICISGFTAMMYELVWVRLLSLVLGSSTYSFSVMLAAFITGITIGSFLMARYMPKERNAFLSFGLCEACIGIFLIISIPFYEKLPYLFLKFSNIFSRSIGTFALYETAKLGISFLVMLPPTIFLGMTVSLASVIVSRKPELFGRNVGSVFAFNTMGNIIGALMTGLVFIPVLGLRQSLELGIIINLGLGILIFYLARASSPGYKIGFVLVCVLAFTAYKTLVPDWNEAYFTAQAFRWRKLSAGSSPSSLIGDRKLLYYKDGLNASVAVVGFGADRTLFVNGKADASTGRDMVTQILLAGLPLILKPSAEDVMVIGLGAGVTCGTALLFPVHSLDVVELSPEVVAADAYFTEVNHDALKDPRLHLNIEDARTFVQRTHKKYDLIVSEPSNPWMSGVGDLFSVEHFEDCRRILKKDGLMAQWVHLYYMDDDTFKIIVKTFCTVFPDVTLWSLGQNDVLLIGTRNGLKPDFGASVEAMTAQPVGESLARCGVKDLFTLLSLQIGSRANIRSSVQSERVLNSDYNPVLEYRAPLALYTGERVGVYLEHLDERIFPLKKYGLFLKSYLRSHVLTSDNMRNLFDYLKRDKNYLYNPALYKVHREIPDDEAVLFAYISSKVAPLQENIDELERLIRAGNRGHEFMDLYASLQVERYFMLRSFLTPEIFSGVMEKLQLCADISEENKGKFYYLMGKVCLHNRDYQQAFLYYSKAEESLASGKDQTEKDTLYHNFRAYLKTIVDAESRLQAD